MWFENFSQAILTWCAARKQSVVLTFCFAWIMCLLLPSFYIFTGREYLASDLFLLIGNVMGKASLLAFFVTTLPGILGRFRLKSSLITLGMMFRRQTGISVFIFLLTHSLFVFFIPWIAFNLNPFSFINGSIVFGLVSLFIFLPLFLSSNQWSQKVLGRNWKRLHRLVYTAYWTLFLHLGLREFGFLTVLTGGLAVLEVASLYYDARHSKKVTAQEIGRKTT